MEQITVRNASASKSFVAVVTDHDLTTPCAPVPPGGSQTVDREAGKNRVRVTWDDGTQSDPVPVTVGEGGASVEVGASHAAPRNHRDGRRTSARR